MKIIADNKKAFFDYEIIDRLEMGIILRGDEVKSIRQGHVSLAGAFVTVHGNELFLLNVYVKSYSHSFQKREESDMRRSRKVLAHKHEIRKLIGAVARQGITLIPLKLYFSDKGKVKVEVALAKHRKSHEKKQVLKERDIERQTRRELSGKYDY